MWWSSSSGRIELQMTLEEAQSVSHQGQCDDDVAALRKVPEIAAQLDRIDADLLRRELKEYGAWDEKELANHDSNLSRILWIAGCDLREEEYLSVRNQSDEQIGD